MNFKKAIEILEIPENMCDKLTIIYLKQIYHKMALINHPDKNKSIDTKEIFQSINEAYNYLNNHIKNTNNNDSSNTSFSFNDYTGLLKLFISNILNVSKNNKYYEIIKIILLKLSTNSDYYTITVLQELFNNIDKYTILQIYNIILQYKNELHINQGIIDNIKNIIVSKYANDELYILNPNIDDLLDNKIYKLIVKEETYYIPLWHNELYYDDVNNDSSGCEIIVKCIPNIPDNISLDENNNLLVTINIDFFDIIKILQENKNIVFNIGKKNFEIPICELNIKKTQYYYFKQKGIAKVNLVDKYNIDILSDIIVKIKLIV
jgi:hypothetical protein